MTPFIVHIVPPDITWIIGYTVFIEFRNRLILVPSACVPETSGSHAQKKQSQMSFVRPRMKESGVIFLGR
jgi:hypothetical protein